MGMVISFPAVERTARGSGATADKSLSATVVILPVIRIERYVEEPGGEAANRRGARPPPPPRPPRPHPLLAPRRHILPKLHCGRHWAAASTPRAAGTNPGSAASA